MFFNTATARAIEGIHTWRTVHYVAALQKLKPETSPQILPVAGGVAAYGGADSPVRKAVGLGFEPITAGHLDQVEAFYSEFGLPACIELCPLANDALRAMLAERGYTVNMFLNMLVRPVPSEPLPVDLPGGVVLLPATADQANVWIRTTAQGFEDSDSPSTSGMAIQAANFHAAHTHCFLVWMDGEPVAGGMMASHNNEGAELGGTSTRPLQRRRGLQAALIHARLNHARELGLKRVVVQTTPGSASQRNLERAGFRVAYTSVFFGQPVQEV